MTITVDGKQKVHELTDAMTERPFVPAGFPASYVGKEAIVGGMPNMPGPSSASPHVTSRRSPPTRRRTTSWSGRAVRCCAATVAPTTTTMCVVKARDDKVTLRREYWDARVAERAFAGVES
ncbi:hypothetical protein FHX82_007041 [Amycolatopsis bartoniae]|uniref:SnoaL-like domain-containing protein n=1 Tax=Amycolatopsis bartoniae TaxID=941986 RepID=A0A8H9IML6_9PSEU|nr:hypothetical protein [Amycolatopsis bartoniae]MBB2939955.1 hypothetical protein [Amycolatopsis bartoniae]TVT10132.1 hypothetical protein FNH07_05995 [Amycolatopsis bartoniae]GHF35486.1 hypothetical protein GCM10017566_05390 [Amycolatopsis bartoniae]